MKPQLFKAPVPPTQQKFAANGGFCKSSSYAEFGDPELFPWGALAEQNGFVSFRAVEDGCCLFPRNSGHKLCSIPCWPWWKIPVLSTVPFSVYPGFFCLHMRLPEMIDTCFPFIFYNEVLENCLDEVCLVVNISVERLGRDQMRLFGILPDVSIFISFLSTCQGLLLLLFFYTCLLCMCATCVCGQRATPGSWISLF